MVFHHHYVDFDCIFELRYLQSGGHKVSQNGANLHNHRHKTNIFLLMFFCPAVAESALLAIILKSGHCATRIS